MTRRTTYFPLLLIICAMAGSIATTAQDVHFSQFAYTPLAINPAFTGVFDGKARFTNDYRSQWAGLTKAYTTIHASFDCPVAKASLRNQYFGWGLMIDQDAAGDQNFKSTIVQTSLSYTHAIDDNADNFMTLGFQAGINQQSFDPAKTTWDSQWNGDMFDPSIPSGELIQLEQFSFADISGGVLFHYVPDGYNAFFVGGSMSHIGSPNRTFYPTGTDPLHRRITIHGGGEINIDGDRSAFLHPRFLVNLQGAQKEIVVGASLRNKVMYRSRYTNYEKEMLYSAGLYYRNQDAFIICAGLEYNRWHLGLSYDYTISSLRLNAGGGSAYEVTLGFVVPVHRGQMRRNYNKMPKFF